jgi:hypothetical protein
MILVTIVVYCCDLDRHVLYMFMISLDFCLICASFLMLIFIIILVLNSLTWLWTKLHDNYIGSLHLRSEGVLLSTQKPSRFRIPILTFSQLALLELQHTLAISEIFLLMIFLRFARALVNSFIKYSDLFYQCDS